MSAALVRLGQVKVVVDRFRVALDTWEHPMTVETTPWRELRAACNFSPDDEARIAARQTEMAAEEAAEEAAYSLAELRKQRQATQAQLAGVLGIEETTLSRREHSTDPRLSTIREQIEALGGRLELVADFDGDRIPLDL